MDNSPLYILMCAQSKELQGKYKKARIEQDKKLKDTRTTGGLMEFAFCGTYRTEKIDEIRIWLPTLDQLWGYLLQCPQSENNAIQILEWITPGILVETLRWHSFETLEQMLLQLFMWWQYKKKWDKNIWIKP